VTDNPMAFFSESVDKWGASEWFDRLAKAIRAQDKAVLAKDEIRLETCRMIAASSAMRLVRDHEQTVRAALAAQEKPEPGVAVKAVATDEVLNNMLLARAPNRRWTLASLLKENDIGYADRLEYMRAAFEAAFVALAAPSPDLPEGEVELAEYFERQIAWSRETFGPALRTKGVIDHIRKELREIEQDPHDLSEWIDVVILAMDGFWRHGGEASALLPALVAKQRKNMARTWPDWRGMSEDSAIEHDRSKDTSPSPIDKGEVK